MLLQGLNTLVRALDKELCVHQYSDFVCVSVYGPDILPLWKLWVRRDRMFSVNTF